ncbi:DUF2809 domain-containing protein [Streptomyces virginiae]|uniref:ribosomal maturation YjgA family protein n=1 Tax=Streptomyces virginiae TaxID=1961 RepID=UPI003660065B
MDLIPRRRDGAAAPALRRTRAVAAAAAVVTVAAGLGLRAAATGSTAKYGGDALYTVLLLTLVVLVAPRLTPLRAAGTALAASWAVEFLQLTAVPADLSRHSVVARLALGSTFNAPDLFWYVVGAAAGCLLHTALAPSVAAGGSHPARRPHPVNRAESSDSSPSADTSPRPEGPSREVRHAPRRR